MDHSASRFQEVVWIAETADPSIPPDFLSGLVALANFMRLSLRKAAHGAAARTAQQKIQGAVGMTIHFREGTVANARNSLNCKLCPHYGSWGAWAQI
jgi:hypothetical protein